MATQLSNYFEPKDLAAHLIEAPEVEIEFGSESELNRYRQNLYSINQQGMFNYRTRKLLRRVGKSKRFVPVLRIARFARFQ